MGKLLPLILLAACSSDSRARTPADPPSPSPADDGGDSQGEPSPAPPEPSGEGEGEGEDEGEGDTPDPAPTGMGTLTGRVHFRLHDGTPLPVAQPAVYWVPAAIDLAPLTDVSSCDCGFPDDAYIGSVDGRFTLPDLPAGQIRLVVQKGHFRRQRIVTVVAD